MAEDFEKYKNALEEDQEENNAYYDLVKKQRFSELRNKEVQLENAKAQASKYTQNMLAAQGLGSQGFAQSVQSGIYNNYMNAFSASQKEYQDDIANIELERRQANKAIGEEGFQQLVSLISADNGDMARVNDLLSDYGFGKVDEKSGAFVWNEKKPEGMSNIDWAQLKYMYGIQNDTYGGNASSNFATYGSLDELGTATYVNNKGNVETLASHFNEETKVLWHHASIGDYKNGDSIKVTNGEGSIIYLQWTSNGFRMVNEEQYEASANKYTLTRGKDKNNVYEKVA